MAAVIAVLLAAEPAGGAVTTVQAAELQEESAVQETESEETVSGNEGGQPDEESEEQEPGEVSEGGEDTSSEEDETEAADTEIPDDSIGGAEETELSEKPEEETEEADDAEEELQTAEEDAPFMGMPEGYALNSAQIEAKAVLAKKAGDIREEDEGVLYAEGEVMTMASSRQEADAIAEGYGAEIISYENEVLVLALDEEVTVAQAVNAAASEERNLPAVWPNYYRYAQEETESSEIQTYTTAEGVEITEELMEPADEVSYAAATNDPALQPTSSSYQWYHEYIGSNYAWENGYTGADIKVAVLDTGVTEGNADLPSKTVVKNINRSKADTANDVYGHGSHVAGIIAAARNNGTYGAGVAPDSKIYNIKVLGDNGSGTDSVIIEGIRDAIANDVDIINMSLGGAGYNQLMQDAINDAYEAGIAVFASAGNGGTSAVLYPAAYQHVICIAAVNSGGVRGGFSNYGSWVDLSAPGESIYSTLRTSAGTKSGTSMACPVAAGEAAVILASGKLSANKGSSRVDELERVMKQNVITVSSSGMGAGVTSLTKVLGISTAADKPKAPEITLTMDGEKQRVSVGIRSYGGETVYYTTNGKNPSYQEYLENPSDGSTKLFAGDFTINDAEKGTIKAISVNGSGVSSAVKSVRFQLNPYVTGITITGIRQVARGKSIQLGTEITPSYAANKSVKWELCDLEGTPIDTKEQKQRGVTLSSSGKLTAAKNAAAGNYKVHAVAKDKGQKDSGYVLITVTETVSVQSVKLDISKKEFTLPYQGSYYLSNDLKVTTAGGAAVLASEMVWTSSNPSVAEVSSIGAVTPKKAGKTTITVMAADSSGKKASIAVTVKQQVQSVTVTGPSTVAAGKSASFQASVAPSTANNKKVTWTISDEAEGTELTSADQKRRGVSINKSGKVTVTKKAVGGEYKVTAVAADGSGEADSAVFTVRTGAISKIEFTDKSYSKVKLFRVGGASKAPTSAQLTARITGAAGCDKGAYTVTSSNPSVAVVTSSETQGIITLTVTATGKQTGKTTITIAANDGSGKKLSGTVTVCNPVSAVHISASEVTLWRSFSSCDTSVIPGKSLQMKSRVDGSYGKVSDNRVQWELCKSSAGEALSSEEQKKEGVSLTSGGKLSVKKDVKSGGIYWIRAVAKDGSGAKDTYSVYIAAPATYIYAKTVPTEGEESKVLTDYEKDENGRMVQIIHVCQVLPDKNGVQQMMKYRIESDTMKAYYSVTSSNSKVIEATTNNGYLYLTPRKKGTAKITLAAMDGSGVKITYVFKVEPEKNGDN